MEKTVLYKVDEIHWFDFSDSKLMKNIRLDNSSLHVHCFANIYQTETAFVYLVSRCSGLSNVEQHLCPVHVI